MKRVLASVAFVLVWSLILVGALTVSGLVGGPDAGVAQADDCPVELECTVNPLQCCFVDCNGRIIGRCITG